MTRFSVLILSIFLGLCCFSIHTSRADEGGVSLQDDAAPSTTKTKSSKSHEQSAKTIKFEGDVVEGIDSANLDSLTAKAGLDDDDSKHLYHYRKNFRKENVQVMKELIHSP